MAAASGCPSHPTSGCLSFWLDPSHDLPRTHDDDLPGSALCVGSTADSSHHDIPTEPLHGPHPWHHHHSTNRGLGHTPCKLFFYSWALPFHSTMTDPSQQSCEATIVLYDVVSIMLYIIIAGAFSVPVQSIFSSERNATCISVCSPSCICDRRAEMVSDSGSLCTGTPYSCSKHRTYCNNTRTGIVLTHQPISTSRRGPRTRMS